VYYKATYARSNGTVAGLIGTMIDITERKQAERRQMMEHSITRVLAEAESVVLAIPMIIRTICETMGWHYGDRYEFDAESGVLRRREFWALDTPELQAFATSAAHRAVKPDSSGAGLVRSAHAAAKPVWIADISKHTRMQRKELVARAGLHGAFAFPLTAAGQVLGVLEFFHRDVREPDAMLIHIAESIGSQIGQFIVRMQAEEAVKFVAMHDSLTNLPNRVMFNERLEQAIAQAQRHERKLAVMFIDLDRFKIINDTLGHESGDALLRGVAQRITEHLRTGDMVARLGGDEFVVLLEDQADPAAIAAVAEKLIHSLTENFLISESEVHVTASIGISTFPADAQDMRTLMKFADIAMYRAKEQGRNTFQFYSDQINVHSVERLTIESQLRGALERGELVLHYQPVMDAKSGSIVGMEALVRWQRGTELLPPGKFIGIAEESGLIVPIGEWVLENACAQQRKWRELGLPSVRIAVNLSPRQFVHRKLVQDIVRVLAKTGCDTSLLELEITESTVMHNAPRAIAVLSELKAMGIRIAIDDFGTGYSSLAYLKRFPIDCLKIDRSFVSDVPYDGGNTAITQAIIAMAHSLGLKVVAEGVETAEQLNFLRDHGCDEMQGYYMSLPLTATEATALLETSFAAQKAGNVTALDPSRRRR
jgi:diguanylate cyclase (GGDEF)-like protein